jgi:TRAP-type mannitol/chloroaromatic compound transport system substrate-binding protein
LDRKEPSAPLFAAIPLGLDALQYTTWYYQRDGLDLWKEMYSKYNFGWVGPCGLNTAENFVWSHKKIESLDDFKGLKYRTVGYWGEIVSALGARVVTLPAGEIHGALEKKILDVAEFANPSADYVMGLHEVCKYVHVPGIHQPTTISELIINKNSWNKISPDLQAIVKEAAKAVTLESWGHCIMEDAKALKKFQEYGTVIVKLKPEIIQNLKTKADEHYKKKAEKDPFFAKVFKSQTDMLKDFNYWKDLMVPQY